MRLKMFLSDIEIIIRTVLSLTLSAIIGLERERHSKPAGLRTHILVCVGANLTMLVSLFMSQKYGDLSPSRIAAQVISGIGFLGAGTIIVYRGTVKGLTTAASLWTVASIGLAVGAGFYYGAIITTFLIISILLIFEFFEKRIIQAKEYKLIILKVSSLKDKISSLKDKISSTETVLLRHKSKVKDLDLKYFQSGGEIRLTTKIPTDIHIVENIISDLLKIKDISEVEVSKLE
ncbi:MAG: MgtC/SapB family protein [bacterium]|nr:MgtC/SapB family protein [bacterium]